MSHRQVLRVSVFALAGVLAITPAARAAGDVPGTKATAKPAAEAAAAPSQLAKERAALARQLEQVNAEIDKLKRAGGVRDDYRLRARLADAEALARRLIELDAKLGIRADGTHAARAGADRRADR